MPLCPGCPASTPRAGAPAPGPRLLTALGAVGPAQGAGRAGSWRGFCPACRRLPLLVTSRDLPSELLQGERAPGSPSSYRDTSLAGVGPHVGSWEMQCRSQHTTHSRAFAHPRPACLRSLPHPCPGSETQAGFQRFPAPPGPGDVSHFLPWAPWELLGCELSALIPEICGLAFAPFLDWERPGSSFTTSLTTTAPNPVAR